MGVGAVLTMPLCFANNCIPDWRRKEPSPMGTDAEPLGRLADGLA
jgi:hypothetical protein